MFKLRRMAQTIVTLFVRLITSSNIYQFSNHFHYQNWEKICNNTITNDPTTPHMSLHYLVKCQCLKATIENKTSVSTHFKKLTTGNNVFIVSVIV